MFTNLWNTVKKVAKAVVNAIVKVSQKIMNALKRMLKAAMETPAATVLASCVFLVFCWFAPEFVICVIMLIAFYLSVFYLMNLSVRTALD